MVENCLGKASFWRSSLDLIVSKTFQVARTFLKCFKNFQILQITLLVADYMNMMGKTAPGLLPSAGGTTTTTTTPGSTSATPKSTSLSRGQSRASSRARLMTGTPVLNDQVSITLTYYNNII